MEQFANKIPVPLEHVHGMTHYFNALNKPNADYASLVLASDELLGCYYEVPDKAVLQIRDASLELPDVDLYESDRRQAIEQFALLPLRELGSFVDDTYELSSASEWYGRTIESLLYGAKEHDAGCMVVTRKALPQTCNRSIQCPRKVITSILTEPSCEPDFEGIGYIMDFEREMALVDVKLAVAKKFELEASMQVFARSERYHKLASHALNQ